MSSRQWEMLWPWADPSQALTPLYQAPKHCSVWSSTSQSCMADRGLWFEVTQEPVTTTQEPVTTTQEPVTTLQVQPHLPQLHWEFPLPSRETPTWPSSHCVLRDNATARESCVWETTCG